jgi:hypothetical protein
LIATGGEDTSIKLIHYIKEKEEFNEIKIHLSTANATYLSKKQKHQLN